MRWNFPSRVFRLGATRETARQMFLRRSAVVSRKEETSNVITVGAQPWQHRHIRRKRDRRYPPAPCHAEEVDATVFSTKSTEGNLMGHRLSWLHAVGSLRDLCGTAFSIYFPIITMPVPFVILSMGRPHIKTLNYTRVQRGNQCSMSRELFPSILWSLMANVCASRRKDR